MTKIKQIFHFERGAFFQGYMTYIIEKNEDKYIGMVDTIHLVLTAAQID